MRNAYTFEVSARRIERYQPIPPWSNPLYLVAVVELNNAPLRVTSGAAPEVYNFNYVGSGKGSILVDRPESKRCASLGESFPAPCPCGASNKCGDECANHSEEGGTNFR